MPGKIDVGIDEPLSADEQAALDAEQAGTAYNVPTETPPTAETDAASTAEGQHPPVLTQDQHAQAEKDAKQKKMPEVVPYDRFKEVNDRARSAEQQASELRERWARLEERQRLAAEAEQRIAQHAQQAQLRASRPDPSIDPAGAQLWDANQEIAQLKAGLQQVMQGQQTVQQTVAQQSEYQQLRDWLEGDLRQVQTQHPEYNNAANHLQERVINFARELGANDQQAAQFLGAMQTMAVGLARQTGRSPAQAYLNLARAIGYQPTNAPQTAAPAAAERTRLTLEQARKGQSMQGLSRVPQESEETINWSTMGAKELADMDEDEFASAMNDPRRAQQIMQVFNRLERGAA